MYDYLKVQVLQFGWVLLAEFTLEFLTCYFLHHTRIDMMLIFCIVCV